MMNLLMAFILAFYFQKWHFMAFWDGKFGIPLAKNVGNTAIKSSLRVASLKSGLWYSSHFKHLGTTEPKLLISENLLWRIDETSLRSNGAKIRSEVN